MRLSGLGLGQAAIVLRRGQFTQAGNPQILYEVAETSDWASTQIALEAALVALDLQGSFIHELSGKVSALDNDLSHLTALFKDNFPACAAAGQAIALSKKQIFNTAAKLESAAISAKRIIFWGSFPKFNSPVQAAETLLKSLTAPSLPKQIGASWLMSKSKKTKLVNQTAEKKTNPEPGILGASLEPECYFKTSFRKPFHQTQCNGFSNLDVEYR
ncbi:unnamed protein product [Echinostoma caproni]|uniref:CbiG_C domain-containing protein n=1 Tax=Echinostoma caproni TaxID=27848 RepID=A0A183B4R8_9TREM|nr:unnamed protein product [Echinostoma caproni]